MIKHFFWAIILSVLSTHSIAQATHQPPVVYLPSGSDRLALTKDQIHWLEDKNNRLSLKDVLLPQYQNKFKSPPTLNFGFSSSTHWFKVCIGSHDSRPQKLILEVTSFIREVTFFYVNKKQSQPRWKAKKMGLFNGSFHQRKIYYPYPVLTLVASQKHACLYVRLKSTSVQFPVKIYTAHSFQNHTVIQGMINAFIYGMLAVMIVYNLFLFFVLGELVLLLYVVLEIFSTLLLLVASGHYLYVLPYATYWKLYNDSLFALVLVLSFLFAILFLETRRHSRWIHRIAVFMTIACSVLFILSLQYTVFSIVFPVALLSTLVGILLPGYLYLKGVVVARYYLVAWAFSIAGTLVNILYVTGITSPNLLVHLAPQAGVALEAVFFSFAIGDKINLIKREKYLTQKQLLKKIKENELLIATQNEALEKKVTERTKALKESNEEIMTQNEALLQAKEELETQQEVIEQQNQDLRISKKHIDQSIRAARNIQQAILPSEKKMKDILGNHFVLYLPKDIVSGDFYWIETINNKIFMAVADCTGHGVPGAFMSMISNTLLDHIIKVRQIYNPARILELLHRAIEHALDQKTSNDRNGMDIALCLIEKNSKKIIFAGAKRPIYYVSKHSPQQLQVLKGTPKSIGGIQRSDISFANQCLDLGAGGTIYLCSDGYIDQNNSLRKKIGSLRFQQLLLDAQTRGLPTQGHFLQQKLEEHTQGEKQRDDILVVGIQI
ncbi:7TM diverse intracellular signaling domain-containing protein [Microscilla marina]|uniref:Serine/threonine kinase with GAF domain n=1 Tax=Microscilla marina ATCC 23134 TaxID=313606 RepID=A1ZUN8_MICM2|nr:7TM diverse intracellular signaling domain-containing protein [Microscilla marina]EAY25924.1 serine/threonine kinase with GAF domain [Microscilla marina ATCC 23134]